MAKQCPSCGKNNEGFSVRLRMFGRGDSIYNIEKHFDNQRQYELWCAKNEDKILEEVEVSFDQSDFS